MPFCRACPFFSVSATLISHTPPRPSPPLPNEKVEFHLNGDDSKVGRRINKIRNKKARSQRKSRLKHQGATTTAAAATAATATAGTAAAAAPAAVPGQQAAAAPAGGGGEEGTRMIMMTSDSDEEDVESDDSDDSEAGSGSDGPRRR